MKRLVLMLIISLVSFNIWATQVDINSANAEAIAAALNGIGLKKAQAIVAEREKNGAFKSLEDLDRVKGIGAKTIQKNKDDIIIGGGAGTPAAAPTQTLPTAVPATAAPVAAPAAIKPTK
jgi:competence protein ComEA